MTSDTAPARDPAPAIPPTANPPNRALVIALIVVVILAAVAASALVLMLLGRDSGAVGNASPTPTEEPTQSAASTPSPTADPTPTATPEPTPQTEPTDGLTYLDYGARATVVTDRLRFRGAPSLDGAAPEVLTAGREVLILSGPVSGEGYEWYFVEVTDRAESERATGWVAAAPAPADAQPDDAWLIRIEPLNCPPDAIDTPMLARMTEYAIANCDVQVGTVQGLVDWCYEGPFSPYSYEPGWASFSCIFLRDRESTWSLSAYFPPEMRDRYPDRGDVVTLTGAVGIDTATYGACTVTTTEPGFTPEWLATEQQIFEASCPTKFVVADVSIEGHITMPPRF